ncbi:MAG: TIGR00180 family glycosyltransferase [Alphaproteobacteria bacterium]
MHQIINVNPCPELTLLVTLKDRFEFTKRMCRYFEEARYPFHVIFADGSLENDTEDFFKKLKNPGFSYEYIRYPKDETYLDYYKKCASAIKKVKTPYVMLADNDDFPIAEGQMKAIEFLKDSPDYVGCNGRLAGVVLDQPAKAQAKNLFFIPYYCKVMDIQVDLDQDSAYERIKIYCKDFYTIYYSIFKTESLSATLSAIQKKNFSTLHACEIFFSCMQLAQGKIKSLSVLTYVRQKGSSQAASSQKSWFFRIMHTNMINDLKEAFYYISSLINKQDKNMFLEISEMYIASIERKYSWSKKDFFIKILHLFKKKNMDFWLYKVNRISFFVSYQLSRLYIKNTTSLNTLSLIRRVCVVKKKS